MGVKTQPASDEALNPHFVVITNPILLNQSLYVCMMSTNNNHNLHPACWEQTRKQLNLTPVITPVLETNRVPANLFLPDDVCQRTVCRLCCRQSPSSTSKIFPIIKP